MAERAVIRLRVNGLGWIVGMIVVWNPGQLNLVLETWYQVQAGPAQHHDRVERDQRGNQESAGEPRHDGLSSLRVSDSRCSRIARAILISTSKRIEVNC